jgi:hypothetical protein
LIANGTNGFGAGQSPGGSSGDCAAGHRAPEDEWFRSGESNRQIPELDDGLLIALTGYGQEEDRHKSQEAGFDEHLVKPPSIEQMKSILAHPKLFRSTH